MNIHLFIPQLFAECSLCKALYEKWSSPGSFKKTAVIRSSCFAFLGSGLSCIGPRESLSYLIVFCQNWERLITACCFSARWRLSWPSWRITLLFGASFTCASMVSAPGLGLGSRGAESAGGRALPAIGSWEGGIRLLEKGGGQLS